MTNWTLSLARRMAALIAIPLLVTSLGCVEPPVSPEDDVTVDVRLTYYHETGDPMYNGVYPRPGAAACSWDFPIGTILSTANGDVLFCADRGMLPERWVDVFVETQEEGQRLTSHYGPYTRMRVLAWGDDKTRPTIINRPKVEPTPGASPVNVRAQIDQEIMLGIPEFTAMLTR